MRLLNRLEEPTKGRVVVDGVDICALDKKALLKERKDIGMIFQSFNLFKQKNVFANIAYPLEISGWKKADIEQRVLELLKFVDLSEKKNAYPKELSGGQRQRVAIARALATKPKVLLCDEATSALDPANTHQILEVLKKAVREFGMTVIMITHQMEVAKDICDRIAVMENGNIIEENTVEELFKNPKTKLTKSFIRTLDDVAPEEAIDPDEFKGTVVRLSYSPNTVDKPILSHCIKRFDVEINFIAGNINKLNESQVGYMFVDLHGEEKNVEEAIHWLRENGVFLEVIE